MQNLFALLYVSKSVVAQIQDEMESAVKAFSIKNQEFGISGYLFCNKNLILQYVEGHESDINQLMENIRQDERHIITNEIILPPPIQRVFPNWSMQLVTQDSLYSSRSENVIIDIVSKNSEALLTKETLKATSTALLSSNLAMISTHQMIVKFASIQLPS
jgi:hypothetical protein